MTVVYIIALIVAIVIAFGFTRLAIKAAKSGGAFAVMCPANLMGTIACIALIVAICKKTITHHYTRVMIIPVQPLKKYSKHHASDPSC